MISNIWLSLNVLSFLVYLNLLLLFQERCLAEESYQVNHTAKYFYLEISSDCLHLRHNLTYKVNDQHRHCWLHKIKKKIWMFHMAVKLGRWHHDIECIKFHCRPYYSFIIFLNRYLFFSGTLPLERNIPGNNIIQWFVKNISSHIYYTTAMAATLNPYI